MIKYFGGIESYPKRLASNLRMLTRSQAAHILQNRICAALCDDDAEAISWLLLSRKPTLEQIKTPNPDSFIYLCRMIGIRWNLLRKTLISAVEISNPVIAQTYEQCYYKRDDSRSPNGSRACKVFKL